MKRESSHDRSAFDPFWGFVDRHFKLLAILPALAKPQHQYENVKNLFEQIYEHEQFVIG